MRIACLQFAPQLGDIENNLNRADAILNRANPQEIDLLVLPELAFTVPSRARRFVGDLACSSAKTSKQQFEIADSLHSGSGITSLWARTAALKYDCVVVVGYPEQVDAAKGGPVSLQYYNSALAINGDGETIANYRKSFLDGHDEPWASEGPESFFDSNIEDLGNGTIAIGMDINPYKLTAPWMAWEFAYHVLHRQSNLIILLMAWLAPAELSTYSTYAREPDMKRLEYWISRLEPIIRAEDEGEIIIAITNRCGAECDALYAGTSCVVGVQGGEVKVYGILGRGERDLLVVDTSEPCLYNLVASPNASGLQRKAATQKPHIPNQDGVSGRENAQTEIAAESSKTMSTIDTILMENKVNRLNQALYSSSLHGQTGISRSDGLSGNVESDLVMLGRPSKPLSGKSSNSQPVCNREEQLATYSREESSNYSTADDTHGLPIPTSFEKERFQEISGNNSSRSFMPINTENIFCSPKTSSLQDSGYPSDSPLLDSAFPINSAYLPGSAYLSDSAYPPESASSTMVNVPWAGKLGRTYYGDRELMRIMKDKKTHTKNAEDPLDILQCAVSPRYDEPRTAFPPDSAHPPESASSMKVNVPWGPQSPQMAKDNGKRKINEWATTQRQASSRGVYLGSNLRSLSLSIPNTLGSNYAAKSACSDYAYTLQSGVSMIVNIPWESEPEDKFYGDQELRKVMEISDVTRRDVFDQDPTVITQAVESFTESSFDSSSFTTTERNYNKSGGMKRNAIGYPSTQEVITPGGRSSHWSSISQRVAAPSRNLKQLNGATDSATNVSRGQTGFVHSNLSMSPSEYYTEPNVAAEHKSTPTGSTVSKPLEAVESTPPTIVSVDQQSAHIENLSTTPENSPDSTQSILFEIPLTVSPDLFPGEGIISSPATTDTKSSEGMSFPSIDHMRSPVDLLQSPTSDWSVNNSNLSSTSPETTSPNPVNSSLIGEITEFADSTSLPTENHSNPNPDSITESDSMRGERQVSPDWGPFPDHCYLQGNSALLFEELVHQPAMSAALDSAESLTRPASPRLNPEQVTDSVCNPKVEPSVNHVEGSRSDRHRDPIPAIVAAPNRRGIFSLTGLRDILRRTFNTDVVFGRP